MRKLLHKLAMILIQRDIVIDDCIVATESAFCRRINFWRITVNRNIFDDEHYPIYDYELVQYDIAKSNGDLNVVYNQTITAGDKV